MKKVSEDTLSQKEVTKREKGVLEHFLTTKPELHKPLGKTAQTKRRRKEGRAK